MSRERALSVVFVALLCVALEPASARAEFSFLNLGLRQEYVRSWAPRDSTTGPEQPKSVSGVYPALCVELMRFSSPASGLFLNWLSFEASGLFGRAGNRLSPPELYELRASIGMTTSQQSELAYKSGQRYYTLLISGGMLGTGFDRMFDGHRERYEGATIGAGLVVRYRRKESLETYEAAYTRFHFAYDTFAEGRRQVRFGASFAYDLPYLTAELLHLSRHSESERKKMYRNRVFFNLVLGGALGGLGAYYQAQGDEYLPETIACYGLAVFPAVSFLHSLSMYSES